MPRRAILAGMVHPVIRLILFGLTLSAQPALAQPTPVTLHYAAYITGLKMIDVEASVALAPQSYRLAVGYRLTGIVGALFSGDAVTTVQGRFVGDAAVPIDFLSTGHFRGEPRTTQIEWHDGNPVITQMIPPDDTERDPVPPADRLHTIDSLSAMAVLLRRVGSTGRCDGQVRTFDGRRLSELQAHTVGEETLAATSRSLFQGTALRCDFEGRQLAGFLRDADQSALRRPQRGSAWFARLTPGAAPVPVRISFNLRSFGDATMYLVDGR